MADTSLVSSRVRTYGGPQLSQQNQKPHGINKIPHGKTKNLMAKTIPNGKTKNLTAKKKNLMIMAKPKTSLQKQKPHSKTKNLTAKTKYLMTKPKTSRQKQNTS